MPALEKLPSVWSFHVEPDRDPLEPRRFQVCKGTPVARGRANPMPVPGVMLALAELCSRVGTPFEPSYPCRPPNGPHQMDISRTEQRVLHALAQGGCIALRKTEKTGKIEDLELFNRDGWRMTGLNLATFRKLKAKKAIASHDGRPYHITRRGLELVRGQVDNR